MAHDHEEGGNKRQKVSGTEFSLQPLEYSPALPSAPSTISSATVTLPSRPLTHKLRSKPKSTHAKGHQRHYNSCHICKCAITSALEFARCRCGVIYCNRQRCCNRLGKDFEDFRRSLADDGSCPHCAFDGHQNHCPNSNCQAKKRNGFKSRRYSIASSQNETADEREEGQEEEIDQSDPETSPNASADTERAHSGYSTSSPTHYSNILVQRQSLSSSPSSVAGPIFESGYPSSAVKFPSSRAYTPSHPVTISSNHSKHNTAAAPLPNFYPSQSAMDQSAHAASNSSSTSRASTNFQSNFFPNSNAPHSQPSPPWVSPANAVLESNASSRATALPPTRSNGSNFQQPAIGGMQQHVFNRGIPSYEHHHISRQYGQPNSSDRLEWPTTAPTFRQNAASEPTPQSEPREHRNALPASFRHFLRNSTDSLVAALPYYVPNYNEKEVYRFLLSHLTIPEAICRHLLKAKLTGVHFLDLTASDLTGFLGLHPIDQAREIQIIVSAAQSLQHHYKMCQTSGRFGKHHLNHDAGFINLQRTDQSSASDTSRTSNIGSSHTAFSSSSTGYHLESKKSNNNDLPAQSAYRAYSNPDPHSMNTQLQSTSTDKALSSILIPVKPTGVTQGHIDTQASRSPCSLYLQFD